MISRLISASPPSTSLKAMNAPRFDCAQSISVPRTRSCSAFASRVADASGAPRTSVCSEPLSSRCARFGAHASGVACPVVIIACPCPPRHRRHRYRRHRLHLRFRRHPLRHHSRHCPSRRRASWCQGARWRRICNTRRRSSDGRNDVTIVPALDDLSGGGVGVGGLGVGCGLAGEGDRVALLSSVTSTRTARYRRSSAAARAQQQCTLR